MDVVRERICNAVLEDKQLTYDFLISLDITAQEISKLLNDGCLNETSKLTYSVSVDYMYQYGVELTENREHSRANKCFEKCLTIDSYHYLSILRMFFACIRVKEFEKAYYWLDNLYALGNEALKVANLYLYLLSSFTIAPEKYNLRFEQLSKECMGLNNSSDKDVEVIERILNGERYSILSSIDTLEEAILKQLLYFSSSPPKEYGKSLIKLVRQRRYDELIEILERRKSSADNEIFNYCLKILKDIQDIIRTENIPECNEEECRNTFDAIDKKNYYSALKFNSIFCRKSGRTLNNLLSYLLFDINELLGNIKLGKKMNLDDGLDRITMPYIEKILRCDDYIRYLSVMGRYLSRIGESDKFDLVCYFTMLSILKGNKEYKHAINCLSNISCGEYSFDCDNCLAKFREHFYSRNFKEAEVSLFILKTGGNFTICDELERNLLAAKAAADYPRDGQARYDDMSDQDRKGIIDRYNRFCNLCNVRRSLYNDISQFMQGNEMSTILKHDLFEWDVNRLKSDMWFAFRNEGLDIKIFSDREQSIIYLRKISAQSDELPWKEFSSIKNLVIYLSEQLNKGNYQECIDRISNLLESGSFSIYIESSSIEIFLILVKSYLGIAKSSSGYEKVHLCELANSYLDLASAINNEGGLNYSSAISEVRALLVKCKDEEKKNTNVEDAEAYAYAIHYSGMSLDDYIESIKDFVDYTVILLTKVVYVEKFAANIEDREKLFKEVELDPKVTSDVLVYLEVVKGRLANVVLVHTLKEE